MKVMLRVIFLIGILSFTTGLIAQDKSENNFWIGQEIWYNYTGGMEFHVKFEEEGLSYQALSKSKPETWWGPFPFNSMPTKKGEHLVTWYEEGYGDYVTLLIDLENNSLYGSALIIINGSPHTHLQSAKIYKRESIK